MAAITEPTEFRDSPPMAGPAMAADNPVGALSQMAGTAPLEPAPIQPTAGAMAGPLAQTASPGSAADITARWAARIRSPENMQSSAEERRGALAQLQSALQAKAQVDNRTPWDITRDAIISSDHPWDSTIGLGKGLAAANAAQLAKRQAQADSDVSSAEAQGKFLQGEAGIQQKDEAQSDSALARIAAKSAGANTMGIKPVSGGYLNFNKIGSDGEPEFVPIVQYEKLMASALKEVQRDVLQNNMRFNSPQEQEAYIQQQARARVDASIAIRSARTATPAAPASGPTAQANPATTSNPVGASNRVATALATWNAGKNGPANDIKNYPEKADILSDELNQIMSGARNTEYSDADGPRRKAADIAGLQDELRKAGIAPASVSQMPTIAPVDTPQAEKDLAIRKWIMDPGGMRGLPKQYQQNVIQWAAEKGITPDDINNGRALAKLQQSTANTAGHRAGALMNIEATLPGLADNAVEASLRLDQGKFVPINKLMQMANTNISDPDIADFKVKHQALVSEYAQLISRGAVGSVDSANKALEAINGATDHVAYARAAMAIKQELAANTKGQEAVKRAIATGKSVADSGADFPENKPAAAPKKISTNEEYTALPSGSLYTTPDGHTRKKP